VLSLRAITRSPALRFRRDEAERCDGSRDDRLSPANHCVQPRIANGQRPRKPQRMAQSPRRHKHSTSSKPASRSALSSASSGK
jgi:hypothetical protein